MNGERGIQKTKSVKSQTARRKVAPTPGGLSLTPPPGDELKAVAKLLADEIKHSIVVAAASPLNESFPKKSYASIMQDYMKKISAAKQTGIRDKAKAILAAPHAKREEYFGRFADKDASVHKKASVGTDTTLDRAFTEAFEVEMKTHDLSIGSQVLGVMKKRETVLKIDLSQGDIILPYTTNLIISGPQYVRFHWETKEPEATFARWEMKFPHELEMPDEGGEAGKAPLGRFEIDFNKFLAEIPPQEPQIYLVRVQPMKEIPIKPRITPGSFVEKEKSQPVGEPSNWVLITYEKNEEEQTQFELPPEDLGHYNHIEFYINSVKCIEETGERSESDEILLGGFYNLSDGRLVQQGTWTVSDDFDQGEVEPAASKRPIPWASFELSVMDLTSHGNLMGREPTDADMPWPRVYFFNLLMFEMDGGGTYEIINDIITLIRDGLSGIINGFVEGYLSQYIGQVAAKIVATIISTLVDILFNLFKALFDDPDDLIAQMSSTLLLNSSKVSYIHSLPGQVNDLGQVYNLYGNQTEFVSNHQVLRFVGGDNSAGGIYDVEVFWKANRIYY